MTLQKTLKRRIRARMQQTGERYTEARAALLDGGRAAPLRTKPHRAVVLKVNERSARVRVLGEAGEVTFRSRDAWRLIPGHVVDATFTKRWAYRGHAYASGTVEAASIDVDALGLEPLALDPQGEMDCREIYGAPEQDDLYLPLWRELTRHPRPTFEFHRIAWSGRHAEEMGEAGDCPVLDAIEMKERGDVGSARALLMAELYDDLRYLDAHAHLGNLELDRAPERALAHYEVAVRIGDLSLPKDGDFFLPWGCLMNRPYHRAMHGSGLALYKLGRHSEAEAVFMRQLALNPPDHVGARYALFALREGLSWEAWCAT